MDDWQFPNFKPSEFSCKCCGEQGIQLELVAKVQELRTACGFPFKITSGWRCSEHPAEMRKQEPGTHYQGVACDIAIAGEDAYKVVKEAMALGFTGIGIAQKGDWSSRFIHVDVAQNNRPRIWSY